MLSRRSGFDSKHCSSLLVQPLHRAPRSVSRQRRDFRRSVNFGPLRFNFSKSGIGASVGVKGARLTLTPRGTTYVTVGRKRLLLPRDYIERRWHSTSTAFVADRFGRKRLFR
ncbi:MAG TPA: DUF4236 domain-containing protein [Thermoanaerobaculia bacterium]